MTRVVEWQQVVQQTPQLMQRVMDPQGKPLSEEELFRLALGLRTRLQQYPADQLSWTMLGRLQLVLNNPAPRYRRLIRRDSWRQATPMRNWDIPKRYFTLRIPTIAVKPSNCSIRC